MSKKLIHVPQFAIVMRKIIRALRGYDWCLIGGRSVEVWVNPPQTPDIDVLVKFGAKDAKNVLGAMADEGFTLDRKFVDRDSAPMFFFSDDEEGVEVDLIGAFEDVHDWAIERSVKKNVAGLKFPVAQPEDIVIMKAYAAVSPRRETDKQARDAAAIKAIAKDVDLDLDYIEIVLSQALADTAEERAFLTKLGVL